jgi:conjugative transfer region lipoprotein (TIGR03751 family)
MNIQKITMLLPLALINAAVITLSGCATSSETAALKNGPTMAQAYTAAMTGNDSTDGSNQSLPGLRNALGDSQPMANQTASAATAQALDQVNMQFPTLPNPTLVMYVYPHFSGNDQAPVPGYYTAFSFYTRIHYALPGEMPTQTLGGTS